MKLFAIATLCFAALASPSFAQQFANLFEDPNHDFGTVAKAATTEHRFYFTNTFNSPIHVKGVRTSCGCTTPSVVTDTVQPGETGCILAVFNTKTHSGARAATVTVTFDKPSFAEVQLHVKGYIRTDVVFKPGEAMLGKIRQGTASSQEIALEYAGKPDWQITSTQCNEPFVHVAVQEKGRNGGRIEYLLNVSIDESAPAGPLQSEILLHTNDRNLKTVSLRLTADIESTLSVSPNLLSLGKINTEDLPKQVLVLKGKTPFKILGLESALFDLSNTKWSEDAKALHTLPLSIKLKDGNHPDGEIRDTIRLLTDLPSNPSVDLQVIFRVQDAKGNGQAVVNADGAKAVDTANAGSNKK